MNISVGAVVVAGVFLAGALAVPVRGDDGQQILTIDHYVAVQSTVPSIAGQRVHLYVRERARAATLARGGSLANQVVLFVHGAGTPGSVAFDVPYQDYSWMAHLAENGFDVFAMDFSGYGRSTRPPAMNDPCNLSPEQQRQLIPAFMPAPCPPTYARQLTTIGSDWNDLGAVVDYIRTVRRVDALNLIAWSLGGPRAGGYALSHPEKVRKLVLLAPAFVAQRPLEAPATLPAEGVTMNKQSRADFDANWDRQVGCTDQYDHAASDSVWSEMLESDPVGATWGPGARRAPLTTVWGWNAAAVARSQVPTLMIAGAHDKQVAPERVRELYAALGAQQKVFADLACSSHNAMWERNHLLLFRASREWITNGSVNGIKEGTIRLGYDQAVRTN